MWKRTFLIVLIHALVRRSHRLDHHPAKLLNGSCHRRGGTGLCVTDIDPVADRLTLADWDSKVRDLATEFQACNDIRQAALAELTLITEKYHAAKELMDQAEEDAKQARKALSAAMAEACGSSLDAEPDDSCTAITIRYR
jgi:hypothetical protein